MNNPFVGTLNGIFFRALNGDIHLLWIKNAIEMKSLGGDPINGGVKENWSFEGLMQNKG